MQRDHFTAEHELFRDQFRRFAQKEIEPKIAEWNDRGVLGAYRFLCRLWQKVTDYEEVYAGVKRTAIEIQKLSAEEKALYRLTNQTIKKITEDMETSWHFNTAIASVMELLNKVDSFTITTPQAGVDTSAFNVFRHTMENVLLLMAPFTPHICEELWEAMGHKSSIFQHSWPTYDKDAIREETLEIVIQINSKVRGHVSVQAGINDDDLKTRVLSDERIIAFLEGKKVVKTIIVPTKLVNIVAK